MSKEILAVFFFCVQYPTWAYCFTICREKHTLQILYDGQNLSCSHKMFSHQKGPIGNKRPYSELAITFLSVERQHHCLEIIMHINGHLTPQLMKFGKHQENHTGILSGLIWVLQVYVWISKNALKKFVFDSHRAGWHLSTFTQWKTVAGFLLHSTAVGQSPVGPGRRTVKDVLLVVKLP